ncbi:hypothetical protein ACH4C6_23660 [Streptomyces sp. NPDC017943]|uniref:hypothetical protein n=1 Tax=Streptomyces sp. NPDC017943 TaxID=3365019 RepID=UPI003797C1FB
MSATRIRRHSGTAARAAAVLALLALGATACADAGGDGRDRAAGKRGEAVRVVSGHAYAVDSSPEAALAFPMNDNVFEGTVVGTRPDVHAEDVLDDGSTFEVVYTPVVVRVDRVHKGHLKKGSEVVVRSMGGTADGVRYEIAEAPAKKTFAKGASLVVFGSAYEAVDSEKSPALTPNFLYRKAGGAFVDATYAEGAHDGGPADRVDRTKFLGELRSLDGGAS